MEIHGLTRKPDNLQRLLDPIGPFAPVYALPAHELALLLHEYNTTDVDDSVLFPFLHGLEGNNIQQNSFFAAARNRTDKPLVPRYRGLVVVRTEEPGFELDTRGNVRYTNQSSNPHEHDDLDDSDDDGEEEDHVDEFHGEYAHQVDPPTVAANDDDQPHMHPVAARHPYGPTSPSTTSVVSTEPSSLFESPPPSNASTSPPQTPTSNADPSKMASLFPDHQSLLPPVSQRKPTHVLTCSFHPDEILDHTSPEPRFVNPRIPDGISLRNFGIQVPIYATLSDVVIYSPRGLTQNAIDLAAKFQLAIAAKAADRGWLHPTDIHNPDTKLHRDVIVYNVYVVSDPFETFEKHYRHLVAIDSKGELIRKTEFLEREKEEMRTLTQSSEIADNVWLGNSADVPLLPDPPTGLTPNDNNTRFFDPFDPSNNPGGYDICIECHDSATFPAYNQLRAVEDRIRSLEEAWKARVRESDRVRRENEQIQMKTDPVKEMEMEVDSSTSGTPTATPSLSSGTPNGTMTPPAPLTPGEESEARDSVQDHTSLSSISPSLINTLSNAKYTPVHSPPSAPTFPSTANTPQSPRPNEPSNGTPMSSQQQQRVRTLPARPAPNAAHVIHLAFPSSPPATPGTLTNMIPFLYFLHSLAQPRPTNSADLSTRSRSPSLSISSTMRTSHGRHNSVGSIGSGALRSRSMSQSNVPYGARSPPSTNGAPRISPPLWNLSLSRPLKVLLHAGDGYTETSVLALSYLMFVGGKTLPEAYLELQVNRGRSFFVYSGDLGVLRRIEARLKADREKEKERLKMMSSAVPGTSGPSNGKSATISPGTAAGNSITNGTNTMPSSSSPSGGGTSRWWRNGLPGNWRSPSLSSSVSFLNGTGMFSSGSQNSSNSNTKDSTDSADRLPVVSDDPTPLPSSTSLPSLSSIAPAGNGENVVYEVGASNSAPNGVPIPAANVGGTPHGKGHTQRPASMSQSYAPGQTPPITRRARASTSPSLPSFWDHDQWFNDPKFDGSFPSRVLPFLYLGNLAHAGNAFMLHALGITHVVSVGECALVPPPSENRVTMSYTPNASGVYELKTHYGSAAGSSVCTPGHGSLWVEEKEGRIKVLDIKGVCDDGIDSLRPQIAPTVDWIDKARAEGGKILIHCRVGVSRSATVTIAYVMHHLNCSLVDAYLMTRSRRLSVLIQPNMRLLYNLCGWEIELAKNRARKEHRELRLGEGRQLNWPFLAREVHILNERYLS